jgi:acyl dehydratase
MAVNMEQYLVTSKQKEFPYDFIAGADTYEVWDEIEIGREYIAPVKYEVKVEDIINYSQCVNDENPAVSDEKKAGETPFKGLIAHPLFITPVGFFCVRSGAGSWIRTPGARNPGQRIEFHEPIRPGDVLSLHMKSYDKWTKRGKYYLTYEIRYIDQHDRLKATMWTTLILPKTREDIRKFMRAEHGLHA